MKKAMKVIVLNTHYNGLSIIQELGSRGIECVAMDTKRTIGTYSRYAKYVRCPDPNESEGDFIEFLYEYCDSIKEKPLLIPTNDEWAIALSKHKKRMKKVSVPLVTNYETMELITNKEKFYKIGEKEGYLTPKTWKRDEVLKLDAVNFPIISKPNVRRMPGESSENSELRKHMNRLRFNEIKNNKELTLFLEKESKFLKNLIFQENVRGNSSSMYTVGIYVDFNGTIKGIFTGKKVRGYPADSGDCIVGENYKLPSYVIENTKRIVKDLNYTGIAEFEYKKDAVTSEYKLIEINPRSWSWIGITPYTGVNIPMMAYHDALGKQIEYTDNSKETDRVRYLKVLEDFLNIKIRYRKDFPSWAMTKKERKAESEKYDKTIYAEFHKKDYLVSLISIYTQFKSLIVYLLKNSRKE